MKVSDLSTDQRQVYDAVRDWNGSTPLLTVGGYAGTGKTSILGVLAKAFKDEGQLAAYATYTGRASSILARKLHAGGVETVLEPVDSRLPLCSTIHRLLYKPVIDQKTEELLGWRRRDKLDRPYKFVVVDEASMVSDSILTTIQGHGVPILAVGDHGQLPPVMARGDLMKNPQLRLERIHRQAEGNPIIAFSRWVREGARMCDFPGAIDFRWKHEIRHVLADAYAGLGSPLDVGILCRTNARRVALNAEARRVLGYEGEPRSGEAVICLKNRPPIYNGMRGVLTEDASPSECEWSWNARIEFPEEQFSAAYYGVCKKQFGRENTYDSIDELKADGMDADSMATPGDLYDFGYAMTVWKAQGSQFEHAIVYMDTAERPFDDNYRRFIYTAVTRGSERLTVLR